MTKAEKLEAQIAAAQCPKGGAHDWLCSWPAPQTYIETCRRCGKVRKLDETLGVGGRLEFKRSRVRGKFVAGEEP